MLDPWPLSAKRGEKFRSDNEANHLERHKHFVSKLIFSKQNFNLFEWHNWQVCVGKPWQAVLQTNDKNFVIPNNARLIKNNKVSTFWNYSLKHFKILNIILKKLRNANVFETKARGKIEDCKKYTLQQTYT